MLSHKTLWYHEFPPPLVSSTRRDTARNPSSRCLLSPRQPSLFMAAIDICPHSLAKVQSPINYCYSSLRKPKGPILPHTNFITLTSSLVVSPLLTPFISCSRCTSFILIKLQVNEREWDHIKLIAVNYRLDLGRFGWFLF